MYVTITAHLHSDWPHFKCSMATYVSWLWYWAMHIWDISVTTKTSIGQPWSRVYLLYMKGVRNIIPDVLDFHVPVVPEKLSVNRIFFCKQNFAGLNDAETN